MRIGFREDIEFVGPEGFRIVHFTPPGSTASIIVGTGVSDQESGGGVSTLVVDGIVAARAELVAKGVDVGEIFDDAGGVFHHAGTKDRVAGPHPDRQSYGSFLMFSDPDGNVFVLQEVTARLPGRVSHVVYGSVSEVEQALRAAAAAHGEYEQEIGRADPDWPVWYAAHMARAAGLDV